MFNKLLANLPFNPSLIDQVAFYSKRLHKETAIRRMGFMMMALGMLVQMFAVMYPAQPTLAESQNDIIRGGFRSREEAVRHCNGNTDNFRVIMEYFGISCGNLAGGQVRDIRSTDYNRQLYSLGRLPYGKQGEVAVGIPKAGTFYMRYLWSWDTRGASTYRVISGTRSNGTPYMVLFDCGNVVIVGAPTPPPPPPPTPPQTHPKVDITKDTSKQTVKVNEIFDYALTVKNTGDVTLSNVAVTDSAPDGVEFVPEAPTTTKTQFKTIIPSLAKGAVKKFTIKAKVVKDVPGRITNTACVDAPSVTGKPDDCDSAENVLESCPHNPGDITACLVLAKTARNVTQNIDKADGTMAKGGDVITYTLSVKNTSKMTVKNFVVQENISDMMEYADPGLLNLHGGKRDNQNIVQWTPADIKPGDTISRQLTIKIKNPIPETPTPASNPGSFDLTLTNVYGNAVNIKLPPSVMKTTEQITSQIPNTGPGTGAAMAFGLAMFAGYFFYRSRLMATELDILRTDYTQSGGTI